MSCQSAVLAQASLPATPEAAEAMAAPPAKKARVEEPKAFGDVNVETASLKIVEGKGEKYMVPLFDNEVVYVVLTPSGPTKIAYGFDMRGQYEERSFNSAGAKASGNESLAIQVELDSEQVKFLEMVEAKFKALFPAEEKYEWTPFVRTTKHNEAAVKVNVCLSGEESALTSLKFIHEGQVLSGKGWEFRKGLSLAATHVMIKPQERIVIEVADVLDAW